MLLKLNDKIDELKEKNDDEAPLQLIEQQCHPVDEISMTPSNLNGKRKNVVAANAMEAASAVNQSVTFVHPLYRRDLKIIGQIGEPNQKDKLEYTSLERQIQRALKKDMMKEK